MTIKQFRVYAPASIANLGPGFDVFGIALDGLGDYVKVRRVSEPGVRVVMKGVEAETIPVKAQLNSAGAVFNAALDRLGDSFGVELEIEKGIPPGTGMGSSGASAAAAAVAAQKLMYESAWFGYIWFEPGNFLVNNRIQAFPATWGSLREAEWWIQ